MPTNSCEKRQVTISQSDLPLSCPQSDEVVWNAHPKVYLPISKDNQEVDCPYCDTHYQLR